MTRRARDGSTPLVEIDRLDELPGVDPPDSGTRLLAKLESVHPGGSIKDRPVRRILESAVARGDLRGRRVLDSSSGNAGIAYASIGAALGLDVTLVVPGNASAERLERIRAHGAELVVTDPFEGYDHAVHTARTMAASESETYWHADQYGNDDNWRAHYEGTGLELIGQVARAAGRAPDAFVAGIGTGGTITGVGRRLREASPSTLIAAVAPDAFPGIEGLKPLGGDGDLVPPILDRSLVDASVPLHLEEALEVSRALARRGLFVGPSSGANVLAALRLAAGRGPMLLTTVLCDTGERYVSTGMWRTEDSGRPEHHAPPRAVRTAVPS
ncbi:MAG: PLP-dependent cysteine synthase family protein [Planctomycetota bacterium]